MLLFATALAKEQTSFGGAHMPQTLKLLLDAPLWDIPCFYPMHIVEISRADLT